ncbi:MAG: FecR family protein [Micropepsaceae bacterium]
MRFICTRAAAVFASSLMLALPSQYAFAGENWRIVDTAGDVKAGGAGFMPIALSNNQTLPADAWIETTATGRAVLARGLESIVVGPNSRVQLPKDEVNGNTQILQTMGSALYQIGKQQKPHFQVDTPYLAAVVKGTTFTVTVEGETASVAVSEGLVEVSTPDHSDVEFVRPGFTASVSQVHRGDVIVEKSNEGSGSSQGSELPKDNNSASDELEKSDESVRDISITTPIGEVELDVKEVSGGLALGEIKQATFDAASGGTNGLKGEEASTSKSGDIVPIEPVEVADVGGSSPVVEAGASATAPGLGGATPPDLGGAAPAGLGGVAPPDLGGGAPPDLGGATPPNLGGATPPDLGGTPPGPDGGKGNGPK